MTNRELSEKLCKLACQMNDLSAEGSTSEMKRVLILMAEELHVLSNENYTPSTPTWDSIKPKTAKKTTFTNTTGRKMPF